MERTSRLLDHLRPHTEFHRLAGRAGVLALEWAECRVVYQFHQKLAEVSAGH